MDREGNNRGTDNVDGGADPFRIPDPEQFSVNIALMLEQAGKAAGIWARARNGQGANPSGPASGHAAPGIVSDIVETFSLLSNAWSQEPARYEAAHSALMASYARLWNASENVEPAPGAARPDKRFTDEDWQRLPYFRFIKEGYFATADWAERMVDEAPGLNPVQRRKVRFYVRQMCEALSPSNSPLTNPQVLREIFQTNGKNILRGMQMLADDLEEGDGFLRLRQTCFEQYHVGENLALTSGKVVARSDLAEIIQYAPATQNVLKRPLLIVPPWINKYYILDLNPDRSFIRWAVEEGHTVFVISWVNPDERNADAGWEDYIARGIEFALSAITERTGEIEVNAVGYCVGGTLLSSALALMEKQGDRRIASATLLATQVDFSDPGELGIFVDEASVARLETMMRGIGYLPGPLMAMVFNMLRARELIWPYVVNSYFRGREARPFDLLYWNADSTRMTPANHSFYLRSFYLENRLTRGELALRGEKLSLGDVTIPVYMLATRDDHISPAESVYRGSLSFGGPLEFVLGGSGHIAGVINPPAHCKYGFQHGGTAADGVPGSKIETLAEWREASPAESGSWWPHWQRWVIERDDETVAARNFGDDDQALAPAPGTYVLVR